MSWADLVALIAEEVGQDAADRIANRARVELGGQRITVGQRPLITDEHLKDPPKKAAKRVGVHISTVYRRLIR